MFPTRMIATRASSSPVTAAATRKRRPVLLDHDGGYDDFLSLILLCSMPHVDLRAVVVTPADCYARPAVSATLKILRLFADRHRTVPVHQGVLPGTNAFPPPPPPSWRTAAYRINALPLLNEPDGVECYETTTTNTATGPMTGHECIARALEASAEPLTILVTGPITNVAAALAAHPELQHNVESIVWMGGALATAGNVRDYEHDGSAEWNVYWDPVSAASLWETTSEDDVPITLFPLDATDSVPVDLEFLRRLAKQRQHPVSDLCGQIWAMTVGTLPSYEYQYHMWDTLTTAYLHVPDGLIRFRDVRTIVDTELPSRGQIRIVSPPNGRKIRAATHVDVDQFLACVLELLRTDFK